jgi:hypothetical protein
MKDPKYPQTPMRNCYYCRWYNEKSVACSAPGVEKIAVFNPDEDKDCILLRYDKTENPKVSEPDFVSKYCVGKKCPFYYAKLNLCTRPSKCPYTEDLPDMLDNIIIR